jgi:hypothetical protein
MKLSKKLFAAAATLGLAAAATVGSTYAWFSMNTDVTVTGMQVTTQTSDNLFVSGDTTEAHFAIGYHVAVNGLLEPVSTVNGEDFFYNSTKNVKGDGSATAAKYTAYDPASTGAFNSNYGTTGAVGYVDYTIYLKATPAANSVNDNIVMSKCNLTYQGSAITEKAWRVAMFATAAQETAAAASSAALSLVSISAPNSAVNFTSGKAVSAIDALDNVSYATKAVVENALAQGSKVYYKVLIRLWLEGEDNTCNNDTFATLTKDYRLDLKFELAENDTNAINLIGTVGNAVATASSLVGTVTLTGDNSDTLANGETAVSFAWKNAADGSAADGTNNEATYTASAEGDYYCEVTTSRGNVYRTDNVHLAA